MLKKKYIINFNSQNAEDFAPNLDSALKDLKRMKRRYDKNFDFEICGLFDGFAVDVNFNNAINAFFHDITAEDNFFNFIFRDADFINLAKSFIKNAIIAANGSPNLNNKSVYVMDAFLNSFYVMFAIPRSIISEDEHERYMHLGPDYLIGALHPEHIFEYLAAPLYVELANMDLLEDKEFRNLSRYMIGLH